MLASVYKIKTLENRVICGEVSACSLLIAQKNKQSNIWAKISSAASNYFTVSLFLLSCSTQNQHQYSIKSNFASYFSLIDPTLLWLPLKVPIVYNDKEAFTNH